ncbi:DUF5672 family protein [Flavobacterium weaverense]|uniref:DUF5672 domain-containing protein n=1 Tax=Flavobacterium weaverense TaxID=271156 RepID=A0A3M0AG74_9FLAO|nr:DUF5672 family protein [Flavobacterium weaverense]RMA78252.1 hypothetical protein BC961_0631 [Flavobacterium weaverense]
MKTSVKIIIPVYKTFFGELEEKSLVQCLKVLKDYQVVLVQPEGLDTSYITQKYRTIEVESFSVNYFKNLDGYNKLLLSAEFYHRFITSKFILVHQLDAFVFKDELKEWCEKGYDYIGAPWIATKENFVIIQINKFLKIFKSNKTNRRHVIFYKVGNGGFSLRKTASHLKIIKENEDLITTLINNKEKELCAIEDVFWSLKAPEIDPNFKIPEYKEALGFAMDRKPKLALELNSNQLPFGCHAINKPKVIDFWKPILDKY